MNTLNKFLNKRNFVNLYKNKSPMSIINSYKFPKFNFARNASLGQKKNINKTNLGEEMTNFTNTENDVIPLELEYLNDIIFTFYNRGREYQLEGQENKLKFSENESYLKIYEFITNNLKHIKEEKSLIELARAISYFKIKDEKTSEILNKLLSSNFNKLRNSCIIVYTMTKINFTDDNLFNKCFEIIKEGNLNEVEKQNVIPFIWAISEKEISTKELNEKIDEFVVNSIELFSEYDLSMIFRFYSKLFYFNYEVLEILIKKCLDMCPKLSLRYILIITKCLSEMNIRNLNLLTGIMDRLNEIIKLNQKYQTGKEIDQFNILTPDYITQVLANLVQIEFIDFDDFNKMENLFFELANKYGINNRDTIFSIISTHFKFNKRLFSGEKENSENNFYENDENVDNIKNYEKGLKKKKLVTLKTKKSYKQSNEIFYEKIIPFLYLFKNDMNFLTTFNIFVIFRHSHVSKRNILRSLIDLYLFSLDKFLKPDKIKKMDKQKVDVFIKSGFDIFDYESQRNLIIQKLKELEINHEKYVEYYENKKNKNKEIKENKENLNDSTEEKI